MLPLSRRSTKLDKLLDTSISKLLQLFRYGGVLHYQNGCKSKTTMTGGLKKEGLNAKKSCYVPFS